VSAGSQQHWQRVREIFEAASESGDRTEIIARLAGGDASIIAEVNSLLDLHDAPNLTLDACADFRASRHPPGQLLSGRYRITGFLAAGGMGEVYAGIDEKTNSRVALKFIGLLASGDPRVESRFRREVELASKIDHPNICRMLALAEDGGERYCAMELLEGETLAARIERQGRFTVEEARPIALALCDGLAAAHAAGVIHRDLKPRNVMLEAGRTVIIDFGLAAASVREGSLTSASAVIGTLAYMAPEQLEGHAGTERSDLFALGVLLYEMLAGCKPHAAKSPFRLAAQKAGEAHSVRDSNVPGLPAVWDEVLTRCLKARPTERFASAAEVKRALERGRPSWRFVFSRPRVTVPLGSVALLLLGAASWQWAAQDYQPRPEAGLLYVQARDAITQSASLRGVQLLERAVTADPAFVQAFALMAVAYADTDQIDKARDAVLHATAAADRRWRLGRGERAALNAARATAIRDFKGATEPYRRLAAETSGQDRIQALLALGRMQVFAGKTEEAVPVFETVLREDPGNSTARVRLASLLARRRDFDRAAKEFALAEQEFRRLKNEEGLADLLLARALMIRTRDSDADRRDLDEVIALSQFKANRYHYLSAQFGFSALLVRERRYDEAMTLMRMVSDFAQKDGLPVLAARAQSELGYLFLFRREPEKALPTLRQALEMAERSSSLGVVATTRMRLGEALAQLGQWDEAVAVMKPAIEWYRQPGFEDTLPLMLIKWGTATRPSLGPERVAVFTEALDLATRNGNETYQTMALQRLAGDASARKLRQAAEYGARVLPLARKVRNNGTIISVGGLLVRFGEFSRGESVLREVEREVASYAEGPDRHTLLSSLQSSLAGSAFYQGRCAQALAEINKAIKLAPSEDALRRRLQVCIGQNVSANLTWARGLREGEPREWVAAADISLRAGDRATAARLAQRAIEDSQKDSLTVYEMEATLLLRAAEGNARLSERCLELSRQVGFAPPEKFGGRQDLLGLWRAVR
jgi:tetratricopeptide (TPR) repeat protein/predicted Ser/Thr protein kinase